MGGPVKPNKIQSKNQSKIKRHENRVGLSGLEEFHRGRRNIREGREMRVTAMYYIHVFYTYIHTHTYLYAEQ